MRDEERQGGLAAALLVTLLMAAGAAAASGDLRLVEAARNQDQPRVRTLLNQHVDVNARSDDGSTALLWAAHWNDVATANLLIHAGANANGANDFRITPLSLACTNGSVALVELLLKADANPNTPIATGETPIMTCASSGSTAAVRMLIVRGADVNAKEPSENQTALMLLDRVRQMDRPHARLARDAIQFLQCEHGVSDGDRDAGDKTVGEDHTSLNGAVVDDLGESRTLLRSGPLPRSPARQGQDVHLNPRGRAGFLFTAVRANPGRPRLR